MVLNNKISHFSSMHSGVESPIILYHIPDGHSKEMPTGVPKFQSEKVMKFHLHFLQPSFQYNNYFLVKTIVLLLLQVSLQEVFQSLVVCFYSTSLKAIILHTLNIKINYPV